MHNLVPLFRKIKQYRQVIIVTHNANLVVNCDAEQVIIATNDEEVISYRAGALEYGDHDAPNSMRRAICDVLEGGATHLRPGSRNTACSGSTPYREEHYPGSLSGILQWPAEIRLRLEQALLRNHLIVVSAITYANCVSVAPARSPHRCRM